MTVEKIVWEKVVMSCSVISEGKTKMETIEQNQLRHLR